MQRRRLILKWIGGLLLGGGTILASYAASATTVAVSRNQEGVVCNGWALNSNIVVTAAHCVLTPGSYSVTTGDETYLVWRIWIHPDFSPAWLYLVLEEDDSDVAILQIVQTHFSVAENDHLTDKARLHGASLFAVRGQRRHRSNASEIEELPYSSLKFTKRGVTISNEGKQYDVCPGDSGTPLFARIDNAPVVVGIIVRNGSSLGKLPSETFCGDEVHAIDAATIFEFLDFIRQRSK
jgi:secreted trypsin-like serine protease